MERACKDASVLSVKSILREDLFLGVSIGLCRHEPMITYSILIYSTEHYYYFARQNSEFGRQIFLEA